MNNHKFSVKKKKKEYLSESTRNADKTTKTDTGLREVLQLPARPNCSLKLCTVGKLQQSKGQTSIETIQKAKKFVFCRVYFLRT